MHDSPVVTRPSSSSRGRIRPRTFHPWNLCVTSVCHVLENNLIKCIKGNKNARNPFGETVSTLSNHSEIAAKSQRRRAVEKRTMLERVSSEAAPVFLQDEKKTCCKKNEMLTVIGL